MNIRLPSTKKFFEYALVILSAIAFIWLLYPVSTVIILSIITVYLVLPWYNRLKKYLPGRVSMLLTRCVITIFVFLPLWLLSGVVLNQGTQLVQDINSAVIDSNLDQFNIIDGINQRLDRIDIVDVSVSPEGIQKKLIELFQRILREFTQIAAGIGGSLAGLLTNIILYIFTVSGLLTGYKALSSYIQELLPIDKNIFDLYVLNLGAVGSSMIKATIVIAFLQAIVTGISLAIAGVPYTSLRMVLAFILGMIPLIGASFVAMPIAIIQLLLGNVGGAIIVAGVNQIITNNIDNVVRPKFIHEDVKINETFVLLSVFAGLSYFGILGVIYGPVILSFILVTFRVYTGAGVQTIIPSNEKIA